jgi:phage repressor protein C with HTH and peptisase S24 domain
LLSDRLKAARKYTGLNQDDFAKKINVGGYIIRDVETNRTKSISTEVATEIENVFGISKEWLTYSTGFMLVSENAINEKNKSLITDCEYILIKSNSREVKFYPNIRASAGNGYINDETETEIIYYPKNLLPLGGVIEAIKVDGDSMEPTIKNGSIIFIDTMRHSPINGKIFVVLVGDEVYVKRIFKTTDVKKLIITSDNSVYPQMEVPSIDCRIIGQVVLNVESLL